MSCDLISLLRFSQSDYSYILSRLFAFIDRSNIGNARIDGLVEDLGIAEGTGYNLALLVFYIPYILVDVPVS